METKKKSIIAVIIALVLGAALFGFFQLWIRAKVADIISDEAEWDLRDSAVKPLPVQIDVNNLADGIYPVSFLPEEMVKTDGGYTVIFEVFNVDLYDAVDIQQMETGGYIVIDGAPMKIESLTKDGPVIINGGLENGGAELISNGGVTFRFQGWDDIATYTSFGKVTLTVPDTVEFVDRSLVGETEDVLVVPGDQAFDYIRNEKLGSFDKHCIRIRIENGAVVEFRREYRP